MLEEGVQAWTVYNFASGCEVGDLICARVPDAVTGARAELIASYGTTTPDLLELVDWPRGMAVTHVAMESTGVYWKCIYYLLESDFTVLLVNAAHVKHVPGRKTDLLTELPGRVCGSGPGQAGWSSYLASS